MNDNRDHATKLERPRLDPPDIKVGPGALECPHCSEMAVPPDSELDSPYDDPTCRVCGKNPFCDCGQRLDLDGGCPDCRKE